MFVVLIDKVHIDGSCISQTVAGILLARVKRKVLMIRYRCVVLISVQLGPKISLFQCWQYGWAREFSDYQKCSANNLSIKRYVNEKAKKRREKKKIFVILKSLEVIYFLVLSESLKTFLPRHNSNNRVKIILVLV